MAQAAGVKAVGNRHIITVLASAAIVAGDQLQTTEATGSNTVAVAASGKAIFGFPLGAIASAATGLADQLWPGDQVWVKITAGTMDATYVGKFADIDSGALGSTGITLTNSNNDCRIMGWDGKTTNYCIVEFIFPETTSKLN